jgi:hypothetical protein
MKKLVTTCILLASVSVVSFAQSKAAKTSKSASTAAAPATRTNSGPTAEMIAERRAKGIQSEFGLTAEQYKGIYKADLNFEKNLAEVRKSGSEPGDGQLLQMKMTRDMGYKMSMTAEQYSKYESAHPNQ